ncbi:MAG: aspartate 1-decarboxylase [Planctomycetota bacterium]|jgi:aspartate 1-decarboxylase|nr:aspartate 1-decarboxylase [Planctomycetota bacterium]
MQRFMMKSKIHGATVTHANLAYRGSLEVDRNLMEMADLVPNEKVQVVNCNNGQRFETYVLEGEAGSGVMGANGGAARMVQEGDILLVISYCILDDEDARAYEPTVLLLDQDNQPST